MLQCGAKKVNPVEPFVTSLPVAAVLPELLTALKIAPQVLLSAPTGAGKSTWQASLVGSEMCIRDSRGGEIHLAAVATPATGAGCWKNPPA